MYAESMLACRRRNIYLCIGLSLYSICGSCGMHAPPPDPPFVFRPRWYGTPLHQAVSEALPPVVEEQLALAGDIEVRDKRGTTPLMLAAGAGRENDENIRLLIARGADVNAADSRGFTPLMFAACSAWRHAHGQMRPAENTIQRMEMLVAAGADVNARTSDLRTVLMVAAGCGGYPGGIVCRYLLEHGANVDDRDSGGMTALMHAASTGHENIRVLLSAGADINARDNLGRTPLIVSFSNKMFPGSTVETLLTGHPDLEAKDQQGWTAIMHAAWNGEYHLPIDQLVDAGSKLEPLGWTPLHAAAVRRDAARVSSLVADGANANARDRWGRTPIMWWARFLDKDEGCIAALVSGGAEVDAVDDSGLTALHIAAAHAWTDEIASLLEYGAKIDARDSAGQTPLMHAASARVRDFNTKHLLGAGAEINAVDLQGRTALMLAAQAGLQRSMEVLLDYQADTRIKDVHGRTARDYAAESIIGTHPAGQEFLKRLE